MPVNGGFKFTEYRDVVIWMKTRFRDIIISGLVFDSLAHKVDKTPFLLAS
ncbi:MAG: hypothetical protein Q7V10_00820 [Methanobacteriaceae archaeon]|jgi:hypothetical protein|nr:hypothetical protein [Methanobacteriaceae archaeon]MDO9628015.1 hypothetical protein [Methanobacteriaceae archaeon]